MLVLDVEEWCLLRVWEDSLLSVLPHDSLVAAAGNLPQTYDWKDPVWAVDAPHTLNWVEFHSPDLLTATMQEPDPTKSTTKVEQFQRAALYYAPLTLSVYPEAAEQVSSPSGQTRVLALHVCDEASERFDEACQVLHTLSVSEVGDPVPAHAVPSACSEGRLRGTLSLPGGWH